MAIQRGETPLRLCIDLAADPITGSLTSAQGTTRRFSGWIGLAAALEAVRAEHDASETGPDRDRPDGVLGTE